MGPCATLTNLHFVVKLLMSCRCGACMQYFLNVRSVANENESELRGFNTLSSVFVLWNRNSGLCFDNV